jgi:hypothetical protein
MRTAGALVDLRHDARPEERGDGRFVIAELGQEGARLLSDAPGGVPEARLLSQSAERQHVAEALEVALAGRREEDPATPGIISDSVRPSFGTLRDQVGEFGPPVAAEGPNSASRRGASSGVRLCGLRTQYRQELDECRVHATLLSGVRNLPEEVEELRMGHP